MTSKGRPRSREYDLRPNLNPGEGAQGTLFSGGERTPANHRGYDAARLQEVRQAGHFYAEGPYPQRLGLEAKLIDNVARSTVPTSLIKHPLQIHASNEIRAKEMEGNAGVYLNARNAVSQPTIVVRPAGAGRRTLLHELGHHDSSLAGTKHSAYDTEAKRGQEEAHADDFAAAHFRDRRGRPAPGGDYAGGRAQSNLRREGLGVHFWNSYEKHRQTGPDAERRSARRASMAGLAVPGEVKGQEPLLNKVTKTMADGSTSRPNWDYTSGSRRDDY